MSGDQHDPDRDAVDARIDALARERGSELRRPAPADGLAHVRTVRRRQQVVRTAGGVGVIALLAIGVNAIVTNDDGTVAPADSNDPFPSVSHVKVTAPPSGSVAVADRVVASGAVPLGGVAAAAEMAGGWLPVVGVVERMRRTTLAKMST